MKNGLKILLLSDTWATLALGLIGPIYAIFVAEIGGDILDASWAYFSFMFTTGIVMFLIGKWEDKIKHKEKLIIAGYSLTAIGCLSYVFVNTQITLVITQIILGLAGALYIPAFDALYSGFLDKNKETSQWGFEESMIYVVTAISAIIGGYVAKYFGFKTLFILMFAISILSIITSSFLLKNKKFLTSH
jgi:MFS transporter, DHA1 family, multidrug resistance protein